MGSEQWAVEGRVKIRSSRGRFIDWAVKRSVATWANSLAKEHLGDSINLFVQTLEFSDGFIQ